MVRNGGEEERCDNGRPQLHTEGRVRPWERERERERERKRESQRPCGPQLPTEGRVPHQTAGTPILHVGFKTATLQNTICTRIR